MSENENPAETLRRAAALMRSDAEAVVPLGVWIENDWRPDPETPLINYTASWHPAVALAVADWLEHTSRVAEAKRCEPGDMMLALTVARAYLNEQP